MEFTTNIILRFAYTSLMLIGAVSVHAINQSGSNAGKGDDLASYSATKDGVTLSIAVPKRAIAGMPLSLDCAIDNQGKTTTEHWVPNGPFVGDIEVADSLGQKVLETRFGSQLLNPMAQNWSKQIPPGKKEQVRFPMSRAFDLSVGDTYTMKIRLVLNDDTERPLELIVKDIKLKVQDPKE